MWTFATSICHYCLIRFQEILSEDFFLVDILVCLVTMDAEAFGPEALSEVQILEKRIPTAMSATPKPQSASVPGQIKLYSIQEMFF